MNKLYLITTALMFASAISEAQIPNPGFESWVSMGNYSNPDKWDSFNSMTSSMSVYTCEKGSPGSAGGGFLKLTSKSIPGVGVVPAIASSGPMDMMTMQPMSGFPFSQRPVSFTGKTQHSNSQGYVHIQLTYWDAMMQSRMPVGSATYVFTGNVSTWTSFNAAITYSSPAMPDSCIITFSASDNSPVNNDYLYIDELSFSNGPTGIFNAEEKQQLSVYPNPASGLVRVDIPSLEASKLTYKVRDISGRTVREAADIDAQPFLLLDVSELKNGKYIIQVFSAKASYVSSFEKN